MANSIALWYKPIQRVCSMYNLVPILSDVPEGTNLVNIAPLPSEVPVKKHFFFFFFEKQFYINKLNFLLNFFTNFI